MRYASLFGLMVFLTLPAVLRAQHAPAAPATEPHYTLRLNFLGILDEFDRNASLGATYTTGDWWSAGLDAAYIFDSKYLSQSHKVRGFILRPLARAYFHDDKSGFFETNFHLKRVHYHITDWLGKDVVNGSPSYEEYTNFKYRKTVMGLDVKVGRRFDLTDDERLHLELFIGLGYRYKKQGAVGGSYLRERDGFFSLVDSDYSYPSFPLGMRFTWKLF